MISSLYSLFSTLLAVPTVAYLLSYVLPQVYMMYVRSVPDLAQRYKAEWALVTGAGSGIGKALAFKLARQGLNVVLVSLDDTMLRETMTELRQAFPQQTFRSVGVTFAPDIDYMKKIRTATDDIHVPIIFNNAGYMVTGFMDQTPIEKLRDNMECNATACMVIAHHFVTKLVQQKQKGCIVFTSSVAGFIPTPFAVLYASTKAFVSQLAASLHIECKPLGIDVCAIHPSPVKSQFYANLTHKVDMIETAAQNAVAPAAIVDSILRCIGACAYADLGTLAVGTRIGTAWVPYNAFSELFALAAPLMPDWKRHNKNR